MDKMNKMKVWECKTQKEGCVFFDPDGEIDNPPACKKCDAGSDWHETTRYEITERKPDYAAMAERRQFGKCYDGYAYLYEYYPEDDYPFLVEYLTIDNKLVKRDQWATFTPCAEPVELDPITLLPKEPEK